LAKSFDDLEDFLCSQEGVRKGGMGFNDQAPERMRLVDQSGKNESRPSIERIELPSVGMISHPAFSGKETETPSRRSLIAGIRGKSHALDDSVRRRSGMPAAAGQIPSEAYGQGVFPTKTSRKARTVAFVHDVPLTM